jgi:hypothetical protein
MGRKKKYLTEEEKRIARNKRAMRYYIRNKHEIKKKNLNRYYRSKK